MVHNHMAGADYSVYNFSLDSAIRGYHTIWNPAIGNVLICKRESGNNKDQFTVVVSPLEAGEYMIVGHIPRIMVFFNT